MKVYLDDVRPTPEGWVRAYWPDEVIKLLETGLVTELSLDHDLGDDERGTGYDVLTWLERAVVDGFRAPDYLRVHSANGPAGDRMMAAMVSIRKLEKGLNTA